MKTPLPKFPHHRGVPEHHFGVKTPLLATLEKAHKASARICANQEDSNFATTTLYLKINDFLFIKQVNKWGKATFSRLS